MKLVKIEKIDPKPSRCIEVAAEDRLFAAGGSDGQSIISHNSVVQRSIIFGCILRPESWRFLGIDLKKVELSSYRAYSNVVLGIATEIEDALTVLRFASETMMKRYSELEQLGLQNFTDLPEKGQALMVMVDEAGELLSPSGVKTEEGKAQDELKGEASMILSSIARLGRAAGVHLVVATQRPDAKIITGEMKANLGARINCGRTDSTASNMILDCAEGTRVKPHPKGRLYLRIYSAGDHGQGFFAQPNWIDDYLTSIGKNNDGSPLTTKKSRLAKVTNMAQFEGADLDSREGVDNSSAIDRIREEESGDEFEELLEDGDEDWDWGSEDDDIDSDDADDEDPEPSTPADKLGRPEIGAKKDNEDKWHRPEDDWDAELEALVEENFE